MDIVSIGRGLIGLAGIVAIALALSSDRRRINWRTVGAGLLLQLTFAILFLKGDELATVFSPFGWPKLAFSWVASLFVAFLSAVEAGATFVFGSLALSPGAEGSLGFFFFAYVLPTVIVFASLMSILYYLGVMQKVVQGVAWVVQRALGTSGPESLSVSANIFVGQTEAPLVIKPYVKTLTRSELMAVMTGGMATIAGGVLASYVAFLGERYAAVQGIAVEAGQQIFAEQLLGASVMAAPAALVLAKILIPEKARLTAPAHLEAGAVAPVTDAGEATQPSTSSD
ncbi:nucleoside recognition domain-containing protein, partial [Rubrivirga sp.]|uniref:nucleoside recognition domain-containing protein n=1 Tax=Rubrivirga sp. TaxID=1885344 RepID=UPI003C7494DF